MHTAATGASRSLAETRGDIICCSGFTAGAGPAEDGHCMEHEADLASTLRDGERSRVTARGVLRWDKLRQLRGRYRDSTCEVVLACG